MLKVQHREYDYTQKFCSDREGNQIEGFSAHSGTPEGASMNCECAFARRYLSEGVPRPTCCPNGNYRNVQCLGGLCYCVDKFGRQVSL